MSCNTSTGNPGLKYCTNGNILNDPIGIIFANDSQSFTGANFELETPWQSAIKARSVFPIMNIIDFVDNSTEPVYEDYPGGKRKLIRQGEYRFDVVLEVNECVKKELFNFTNFRGRVYFAYQGDSNGVIRGTSTDAGDTIKGARINQMTVLKETLPTKDASGKIMLQIDLENYKDLNQYDHAREMAWDIASLDSLTEVDLAQVGTASATAITISVLATCYGVGNPISGLAQADFTITGTGTISDMSEDTAGNYTFVTVGLISGDTINLVTPPNISVSDLFILSSGAATATVT